MKLTYRLAVNLNLSRYEKTEAQRISYFLFISKQELSAQNLTFYTLFGILMLHLRMDLTFSIYPLLDFSTNAVI